MGCDKNDKIFEYFLRDIGDDDREVLRKLFNLLVRKCCRYGMWNLVLEGFGRFKDFGYKSSRLTYDVFVRVFLEVNRLDTVRLFYREMLNVGFRMDIVILSSFVYVFCKEGKWREVFDLIEKEDVVLDIKFYIIMIFGLCEVLFFVEVMDFLNKMRCSFLLFNVVIYRVLFCGCLNKR